MKRVLAKSVRRVADSVAAVGVVVADTEEEEAVGIAAAAVVEAAAVGIAVEAAAGVEAAAAVEDVEVAAVDTAAAGAVVGAASATKLRAVQPSNQSTASRQQCRGAFCAERRAAF